MAMRSYRILGAMAVLLAALSSGCDNGGGGGAPGGPSDPANPAGQGGPAGDLQGTWESTCLAATSFGLTETSRIAITGQEFTQTGRVSASGNCSTNDVEVTLTGQYQRRAQVSGAIYQIDTTFATARIKPITVLGAEMLKLAGWCGFSDWAVGQEKDVTAKTGADRCFQKLPATIYTIYTVEGGRLYFGKGGDVTQPARRPVELDREDYYIKR